MKTQLRSPLALALLALLLALPGLRAASANPPDRMTYQGFLVDANGVALGNTQPANHTVEFRIYDASSGGTVKWGEVQTVTVDKGYFSVMLGDGSVLGGAPNVALSTVFQGADASDRFISLKVPTVSLSEILPRLRLVTAPYAYMATTLPAGAITNGLFAAASITGDKLATNTLTAANFSTNVGLWTASGTNIYRTGGLVGINALPASTPYPGVPTGTPLDVRRGNDLAGHAVAFGSQNYVMGRLGEDPARNMVYLANTYGPTNSSGAGIEFRVAANGGLAAQGGPAVGLPRMTILNNGNVGIGRSDPAAKLHVYGDGANEAGNLVVENAAAGEAYPMLRLRNNLGVVGGDGVIYKNSSTRASDGGANTMTVRNDGGDLRLQSVGANGIIVKATSGMVGIGTPTPSAALEVVGGSTGFNLNNASYYAQGGFDHGYTLGGNIFQAAIKASWHIYSSTAFYCGSDARIKNVQGLSDSADDLRKLTQIEITDYLYKDQVVQKSGPQKKVIAQQVEKVFPQAVSKSTDVVPDIFQKAIFTNGWVELATDLKVGERVKLMGENNGGIHEVLEVREGAFRTAFKPTNEKVFVYGREVKDFHTVDYDALSMLNVSATQELARKVQAQETELTELRAELAKLRGERKSLAENLSNLEAGFARLEKALSKPTSLRTEATARQASLTTEATARQAGDVIGASK